MIRFWRTFGLLCRIASVYGLARLSGGILSQLAAYLHLGIYGLVFALTALVMATNSEKSRTLEARVSTQIIPAIGTLNAGLIQNVDGVGNTVRMTGTGTLWANALGNLSNPSNTSFLSGLRSVGVPSSPASAPSSYNQSWGQNITGVLNTIIAFIGQSGIW